MPSNGSWQKVRFDQICKKISNIIDDPKQADTDYYIGLEHLDSEEPKILRHGSPQDVVSSKSYFKKGQILFGRRRVYLKKLAIANRDGICSTDIYVMEPKSEKIIDEFLPIFMQSEEFYERTKKLSAGSLSPRVKWSQLSKQEFLIPPIPEQETILSLTHQIDDAITKTQSLLQQTKIYSVSKREDLLTRGIGHTKFKKVKWYYDKTIEIPEEWEVKQLGDVVAKIQNGLMYNVGLNDSTSVKKNLLPITRIETISEGVINPEKVGYVEISSKNKSNALMQDDILLSHINSRKHVGKTAIYEGQPPVLIHGMNLLRIVPKNSILPYFLYYFLKYEKTRDRIRAISQPAVNQVSLTTSDLKKSLRILLPPLPEQQKIASIISNINEQISQQQSHLSNLKTMRKSILNSKLTKEKTIVAN